jgi:hypothetical protein
VAEEVELLRILLLHQAEAEEVASRFLQVEHRGLLDKEMRVVLRKPHSMRVEVVERVLREVMDLQRVQLVDRVERDCLLASQVPSHSMLEEVEQVPQIPERLEQAVSEVVEVVVRMLNQETMEQMGLEVEVAEVVIFHRRRVVREARVL